MSTTVMVHLVARAYRCGSPLIHHEIASWLWARLARSFPQAAGAVLMPDHIHLVTPAEEIERARVTFARIVGNLSRTRRAPGPLRWEHVETPPPITDALKLMRQLRYLALNPVRAGLARDPLAWPWSTYRDVMGGIADPWTHEARIAALLRRPRDGFRESFHRYVSSDPSCDVAGSPAVRRPTQSEVAAAPLSWMAEAAAASSRGSPDDIRRRSPTRAMFLAIASSAGSLTPLRVAQVCAITPSGVHASWSNERTPPKGLDAAMLCMGDPRLRIPSRRTAAVSAE